MYERSTSQKMCKRTGPSPEIGRHLARCELRGSGNQGPVVEVKGTRVEIAHWLMKSRDSPNLITIEKK